jgi:outer membrane protein assembly factor BamA
LLCATYVSAFSFPGSSPGWTSQIRVTSSSCSSSSSSAGGSCGGFIGPPWGGGGGGGGSWNSDDDFDEFDAEQNSMRLAAAGLLFPWQKGFRWPRMPWDPKPDAQAQVEEPPPIIVKDLVVNGTQVIPKEVLTTAGTQSGLLGAPFNNTQLAACVSMINSWYQSQGYALSTVVQAGIFENGAVVLQVREPVASHSTPVSLMFLQKQNATDPASPYQQVPFNKGKTQPKTIQRALGIKSGELVKLDAQRMAALSASPLYELVHVLGGTADAEGAAILQIGLCERKSVAFEPGVTKTLFDSHWAGEVTFEDKNVLGRNYAVGLDARRSMGVPKSSFKLRVGNDRFSR